MTRLAVLSAAGALALGAIAFSLSGADQKPLPWEKNRLQVGQALYRANCVVCHDIDRPQAESKKFGPSFYQLFRRDKMPLAAMKPNRDYIKIRVKFGGAIMPAFAKTMNDSEIETMLDYMQSK
jgi:mono/diheme cytochrome c family protein